MVNKIYCGDCLFVMRHDILERGIKVDLIYLDPPFFTGKVQKGTWEPGAMEISFDDSKKFWGTKTANGAPTWIKMIGSTRPAFAAYLEYMRKRLELCKRVLKDTGTIYLHCDYRASHYLKMLMDGIFGIDNFRNEIIWYYRRWPAGREQFQRNHDTIYFYTKSRAGIHTFNTQYIEPTPETLKRWGRKKQRVTFEETGKRKPTIELEEKSKGVLMPDVWEISIIAPSAKERLGYPTQKPLTLLERIVNASSNPGDLILDPFCGCGTAIVAAHKLNRKWIGIDLNPDACTVMEKRFEDQFNVTPELNLRNIDDVKKLKPMEFEVWVNEFYQAKKPMPDRGVDGITDRGIPIQTKTNIVKYNIVSQFLNDMRYHPDVPKPVKHGIIVSQIGFDESAMARVFQIKEKDKINIKLVTPEDLL